MILFAMLGIGAALLASNEPTAAGICLVALFAMWLLEVSGLPTPMSLVAPKRATQDLFHQGEVPGGPRVLMLVRPDAPLEQSRFGAQLRSGSWAVVGASIVLLAILAAIASLTQPSNTLSALSMVPSLALLICASGPLLSTRKRESDDPILSSGLPQALDAIQSLTQSSDPIVDLMVVGASTTGRDRRVLRKHQECFTACRTWEYATAAEVVSAVRSALT
ncbi:MAG: hypothetical protein NTX07_03095 [Solirubrobacterales bacterium]|nr:hypothetical protein [Solirubrobacterales bacterium]